MRTKKHKKVNIITLGCSKNLVDSEQLARQLQANEFDVKHENKKINYDISIINTCGFIESAKEESINTILQELDLKQKGKIEKVYVTGCLSERYKKELNEDMKDVDAFFGTMELPNLLKELNADYKKDLLGERLLYTPKHYAYLKISEGCNRTCAFCAIPLMRGKHTSKTIEDILKEATFLAQYGTKEILLIAQELTYYGLDIYKKRMLPELLNELCKIEGIEWIRLHYAYPSKFPIEIIDSIKNNSKICNYLDMPLQHASNNILHKMKRQITVEEMQILLDDIRNKIPNIALRTTFLVGFPDETEDDFLQLCNFIKTQRFDRVGVFKYSHEENTTAYNEKDTITEQLKEERYNKIMEIQQIISTEKNTNKIGKILKVIIDKKEAGKYIGRTEADSPEVDNEVIIDSKTELKIGEFYSIKITSAFDYDLNGIVI